MAITFSAPRYSFVQMEEMEPNTGCAPEIPLCLPVYSLADLKFQIIATVPKVDEPWFEVEFTVSGITYKDTIYARICVDCGHITANDPGYPASLLAFPFYGSWVKTHEGGSLPDTWVGDFDFNINYTLFALYETGICFNICFHRVRIRVSDGAIVLAEDVPKACSATCFQKIDDPCFTSKMEYACNENSFGFIYNDLSGNPNFSNKVRLPCYLRDMQLPSEEKSYRKSDGTRLKLSERIDEEYELNIDWMYKSWHKRLKVALAHDSIGIDNPNEDVGGMPIVCEEKYEINWPTIPWQLAPAKTRVKRSEALSLLNSNCK